MQDDTEETEAVGPTLERLTNREKLYQWEDEQAVDAFRSRDL